MVSVSYMYVCMRARTHAYMYVCMNVCPGFYDGYKKLLL